jgi:hypothetical protein
MESSEEPEPWPWWWSMPMPGMQAGPHRLVHVSGDEPPPLLLLLLPLRLWLSGVLSMRLMITNGFD